MGTVEQKWDQDVSGYYTRQLVPEVTTKVYFPEKWNIGISYCHLLLHDTMLRDDSFRTGTSDTPVCACGLERETATHFLLYCNRFQEARNLLLDTVTEISDLWGLKKRLCLSEALLLAPMSDEWRCYKQGREVYKGCIICVYCWNRSQALAHSYHTV